MRSTSRQSTQMVEYNRDSYSNDNDEDVEFVDIDLPCNKLSL